MNKSYAYITQSFDGLEGWCIQRANGEQVFINITEHGIDIGVAPKEDADASDLKWGRIARKGMI